jgi:hypothetical protein
MGVSGQHHAPATLYPRGKDPRYPLDRRLGGPRAGLDAGARRKILCPCRGSNPDRPARSKILYYLSCRGSFKLKILNYKLRRWGSFQWHAAYTKFNERLSIGSEVIRGSEHDARRASRSVDGKAGYKPKAKAPASREYAPSEDRLTDQTFRVNTAMKQKSNQHLVECHESQGRMCQGQILNLY